MNLLDANESNLVPADRAPGDMNAPIEEVKDTNARLELWWWLVAVAPAVAVDGVVGVYAKGASVRNGTLSPVLRGEGRVRGQRVANGRTSPDRRIGPLTPTLSPEYRGEGSMLLRLLFPPRNPIESSSMRSVNSMGNAIVESPASDARWLVFWAAFLGWMFDGLEMGIFPLVARPALQELRPGADDQFVGLWMGYVTALFLVGAAVGGLLFGWLGDRFGRVRTMALSVLTYSLFTGLCFFATAAVASGAAAICRRRWEWAANGRWASRW